MRQSPEDSKPERRSLRIFTFDPMLARGGEMRATVDLPYRPIEHAPTHFRDDRLEVIDYDGAAKSYYRAINLDAPEIALQQGLEPSESDPQFHQQMVYAVASRVLESVDRALGRRVRFAGGQPLRLMPHAFQGRNAYYDDDLSAVLFGYFAADEDDPGANLPGQTIFTCLSHDIVAHEVAHAVLDRLRRHFREPTNPHVPALHEAFADIVAIFQRFTITDVVRDAIRQTRGDLLGTRNNLQEIGAQFGAAAGLGTALRRFGTAADPNEITRTTEPHALGRILVSAIFEGFVRTFEKRTVDLIRIATGGSGRLPEGEIHPDLVARLTIDCSRTAQAVLAMCVRATDYLPPVDPTFSDYLRAMVTADYELNRDDASGLRAAMIEAFRVRGIRPETPFLAVDSLLLPALDRLHPRDPVLARIVEQVVTLGAREMSRNTARPKAARYRSSSASLSIPYDSFQRRQVQQAKDEVEGIDVEEAPESQWSTLAKDLHGWAKNHWQLLGLESQARIRLDGFHPVHRVAPSGEMLVEMVAQFVQTQKLPDDLGGLAYRAGVTLVATMDGGIRYLIKKPFEPRRLEAMRKWVGAFDTSRPVSWNGATPDPDRVRKAFSARAIDGQRWRGDPPSTDAAGPGGGK